MGYNSLTKGGIILKLTEKQYYEYYQDQLKNLSIEGGMHYIKNCLQENGNPRECRALMRHFKELQKQTGRVL